MQTTLSFVVLAILFDRSSSLQSPSRIFSDILSQSELNLFEPVADLGYFEWKLACDYKCLSEVTDDDIKECISATTVRPKEVISLEKINEQCPKDFIDFRAQNYPQQFPHHSSYLPALHVAVVHRQVDLHSIDFVFGGSALDMRANCRTTGKSSDSKFLAKLVPGTKIVIVARYCNFISNYSEIGFQFERLATGGEFYHFVEEGGRCLTTPVHAHLMKVGKYQVLFSSEIDAVDGNEDPVEIKTSPPKNWGRSVVFQLISSGSVSLLAGSKSKRTQNSPVVLQGATKYPLSWVIEYGLQNQNIATLENNIVTTMDQLKTDTCIEKLADGGVIELYFVDKKLRTRPFAEPATVLLPPSNVVRQMLRQFWCE